MRICWLIFFSFLFQNVFAQPVEGTLLDQWKDTTLVGTSAFDNTYNDVWGVAVNGKEYAIIGSTWGTHIIDVTNPNAIFEVTRFKGKDDGPQIIHRDYHEYAGHIYAVSDEGVSSLQIIDISNLPDTAIMVYDSDEIFVQSHNIFIDTTHARMYSFLTSTPLFLWRETRGVTVYDLSDPAKPEFVNFYNDFGDISPNHVHDGYIRDHIAFLNCGNDGFAIMDFEDLENPKSLGTLPPNAYLQSGYNHSGWASDDCSYYYMADETWGTDIKAVNLSDKTDMTVTTFFDAGNSNPNSITHNQVVACDFLYVSYYYDGLQVFDISDPSNPIRAMYYNTASRSIQRNYEGAWGVYPHLPSGNILVSDMQEGLFVIEAIDSGCEPNANLKSCKDAASGLQSLIHLNDDLKIVPNPISDILNFSVSEKMMNSPSSISVLGLDGQLLYQKENFNLSLNNSVNLKGNYTFANGIYFLQIRTAEFVAVQKFIVSQ